MKAVLARTIILSLLVFVVLSLAGWAARGSKTETIVTSSCDVCLDIIQVEIKTQSFGIFGYADYRAPASSNNTNLREVETGYVLHGTRLIAELGLSAAIGVLLAKISVRHAPRQKS